MEKLSVKEIAKAVGGKVLGSDTDIYHVCTDNREAKVGSLFVAISGENHDGHKFAESACKNGAVALLLGHDIENIKETKIIVKDTKAALGKLAGYYLEKLGTKVLAVTGSVGKTTTRNMAHGAFSGSKKAIKTIKNFNNDIGLPLTVLTQVEADTEVAVLEMGMNHFGEISYLSNIAKPDVAIITNIGMSHIENLGSREGILKAKLEICDGLKKGGLLILNGDEPLLRKIDAKEFEVKYFSIQDKNADYYAENICQGEDAISFDLHSGSESYRVNLNVPGEHNVYNAMASFAAAMCFGADERLAIKGIESFRSKDMRMEIIKKEDFSIINDCYNASPDSMKAALNVLYNMKSEKKIAVLGDMLEMGSFASDAHFDVGKIAAQKADKVICIGKLGRHIKDGAEDKGVWFESKEEAIKELNEIKKNSVILIKASRGMHFEEITAALSKK